MQVLVRKISYNKWDGVTVCENGGLPADVLSCLKTEDNTLSVWTADLNDPESIEDAQLAIVAALNSPGHVEFICLDSSVLVSAGFEIESTPESAFTSLESLKKLHYDVVRLNTSQVVGLAKLIVEEIKKKPEIVTAYGRAELLDFIRRCLFNGKMKPDNIAQKFLDPLCKHFKLKIDPVLVCKGCDRKNEKLVDLARRKAIALYVEANSLVQAESVQAPAQST